MSARSSNAAPPSMLAGSSSPGRWPSERPQHVRHQQADEADDAGHRRGRADAERRAGDDARAACARGRCPRLRAASSPSVSASSARPHGSSSAMPASIERRAEPHLGQAAVGQRAHHPEHHLDRGERVLRQVEGERDQRGGDARDGEPGQDQRHRPAVDAGQRHHGQHGDRGAQRARRPAAPARAPATDPGGWRAPRPAPRRPRRRPGSARPADCADSPAAPRPTVRARRRPARRGRRAAGGSPRRSARRPRRRAAEPKPDGPIGRATVRKHERPRAKHHEQTDRDGLVGLLCRHRARLDAAARAAASRSTASAICGVPHSQ